MIFKSFKMETAWLRKELNKKWEILNLIIKILIGISISLIGYLIYQVSMKFM